MRGLRLESGVEKGNAFRLAIQGMGDGLASGMMLMGRGKWKGYTVLGRAHSLARCVCTLGFRPSPQATKQWETRLDRMVLAR